MLQLAIQLIGMLEQLIGMLPHTPLTSDKAMARARGDDVMQIGLGLVWEQHSSALSMHYVRGV